MFKQLLFITFFFSISTIVVVRSDFTDCVVGGWKADTCVNNTYFFNNTDYTIVFNNTKIVLPPPVKIIINGNVTFAPSAIVHYHCDPYSSDYDCIQIIVIGNLFYQEQYLMFDMDLSKYLDEFSTEDLYYRMVMFRNSSIEYIMSHNSFPHLIFANITTSPNSSYKCILEDYTYLDNRALIICKKNQLSVDIAHDYNITFTSPCYDTHFSYGIGSDAENLHKNFTRDYYTKHQFVSKDTISWAYLRYHAYFGPERPNLAEVFGKNQTYMNGVKGWCWENTESEAITFTRVYQYPLNGIPPISTSTPTNEPTTSIPTNEPKNEPPTDLPISPSNSKEKVPSDSILLKPSLTIVILSLLFLVL
ncbi:hypothetical protein CYY_008180 [Polysphondylium violaceum]|uniref:Uncharacterized protein n=1 Tax=Polysphondylium violaceum TaxID=133409 RepID=A0A8J4PM15_9MYCE|nr:hypothetical protein CYY_008180 [Polysphondylium violaceum]